MVKVCCVFGSKRVEIECEDTLKVKELKWLLLKENWPQEEQPVEDPYALRFFSMGKELDNSKYLKNLFRPDPNEVLPILVVKASRKQESRCCSCYLF